MQGGIKSNEKSESFVTIEVSIDWIKRMSFDFQMYTIHIKYIKTMA